MIFISQGHTAIRTNGNPDKLDGAMKGIRLTVQKRDGRLGIDGQERGKAKAVELKRPKKRRHCVLRIFFNAHLF